MNSSTGMPFITWTFLKTSSAIGGRCALPVWVMNHRDTKAQRTTCFIQLSPCRVYRLAHEPSGIRALLWPVFLNAPVIDFRNVKVSFLVHAETMNAPESSWKVAPHAPGIKELSIEIVL